MSRIHPSALVDPAARLHPSVAVGPFSIIEGDVEIGPGCVIGSGVRICAGTRLGGGNRVDHGAVLGAEPQDLGYDPASAKPLVIGDDNRFREGVNISRGVKTDHGTRIGDRNYFMCGFHAGHDCRFGSDNVFGPNTVIAGHVTLGDHVFVSGVVAIHQFTYIGDRVMLAGAAKVVKDIPPYTTGDGNPARICGLNSVGLRRAGIPAATRSAIKQAYKIIYHSNRNTGQALDQLRRGEPIPEVEAIIAFFERSERGVTAHR